MLQNKWLRALTYVISDDVEAAANKLPIEEVRAGTDVLTLGTQFSYDPPRRECSGFHSFYVLPKGLGAQFVVLGGYNVRSRNELAKSRKRTGQSSPGELETDSNLASGYSIGAEVRSPLVEFSESDAVSSAGLCGFLGIWNIFKAMNEGRPPLVYEHNFTSK